MCTRQDVFSTTFSAGGDFQPCMNIQAASGIWMTIYSTFIFYLFMTVSWICCRLEYASSPVRRQSALLAAWTTINGHILQCDA
jgi:hypothetical protein